MSAQARLTIVRFMCLFSLLNFSCPFIAAGFSYGRLETSAFAYYLDPKGGRNIRSPGVKSGVEPRAGLGTCFHGVAFRQYGASTAPTRIRGKFGYRSETFCPKTAGFAQQLFLALSCGAQIQSPTPRSGHNLLCKRSSPRLALGLWYARALLAVCAPSRRPVSLLAPGTSSSCPTPRPASGDPHVAMSPTVATASRERCPFE